MTPPLSRRELFRRIPAAVATGLTLGAVTACTNSSGPPGRPTVPGALPSTRSATASPTPSAPSSSAAPQIPGRDAILDPQGLYFGVSTLKTPSPDETAAVAQAAGRPPTILEYFIGWTQEFKAQTVLECYREGAVPLLTWEPKGASSSTDQPAYALSRIISGQFDDYITRFAQGIKDQRWPVILRFAHEMNGDWYPWCEDSNGNRPGDYVKAWRHVHHVFTVLGVENVIWLWSPNVLRGTGDADLGDFFPGDPYIDWAGVDAYGFGERTASEILDPAFGRIKQLTQKPILIAETGSQPGPQQPGWTADLFRWIGRHRSIVGFVWFNHSVAEGGKHDYRFTANPATQAAFRSGLASLRLTGRPAAQVPPNGG